MAPLACRNRKGSYTCHDIGHHITGIKGLHQLKMLFLQSGVPVHLGRLVLVMLGWYNWSNKVTRKFRLIKVIRMFRIC